ncbi:hypothetical protein HPP92_014618 [Vanilla planifolia]|uniref:DUF7032 domain-containing protein n=2 Tax=Vanilla planifolia TaxID=51239 RepID=A0A835QU82_VANPL|nr:hypothetical protein HPP92_014618 [Vanilla planifolia]
MRAFSLCLPVPTQSEAWCLVSILFAAVVLLLSRTRKVGIEEPSGATAICEDSSSLLRDSPLVEGIEREQLSCGRHPMAEVPDPTPADQLLSHARLLLPTALEKARAASGFPGRWKSVVSRLEMLPTCLSDLSTHPFFYKNPLCREQLQSVCATIEEAITLAERCPFTVGKLQMQSDLDSLSAKLELNLQDCNLLIKTAVLGEAEAEQCKISDLLARLQIGHAEAKHRAVEGLVEAMGEDEKKVLGVLGRSSISALVHLLSTSPPRTREKAVTIICMMAESCICRNSLASEGVFPPLIRLVESGTPLGREKAVMALERLSMSTEVVRSIVGHGGIPPLVEACRSGNSVAQSAAAATLKNLSAVPEVRQSMADEGAVKLMIDLLDSRIMLGSKEYAAECLQNLTAGNESLRRAVVAEGGLRSLLAYIDGPTPQESAVVALRNLVGSVSVGGLVSMGILPRLAHVLREGSPGAQQAAASTICKISGSTEVKKLVGDFGCLPLLVRLMEAKSNGAREAAAQAVASLMSCTQNSRDVKKEEKGVPNLVQLLDPSPQNTAKKYAVSCLLSLSSSKKCKKLMCSHGAIGYLKKLSELDVPGAKKLLERLEKGKLRSLFSRK